MRNNLNLKQIGERVKQLRNKKHYTQVGMALELHTNVSRISRIETGQQLLSVQEVDMIVKKFGVSADFILYGKNHDDSKVILRPDEEAAIVSLAARIKRKS